MNVADARAARGPARRRSEYRAGATRVSVLTEPTDREDYPIELTLILRKGRARRVGYADC